MSDKKNYKKSEVAIHKKFLSVQQKQVTHNLGFYCHGIIISFDYKGAINEA